MNNSVHIRAEIMELLKSKLGKSHMWDEILPEISLRCSELPTPTTPEKLKEFSIKLGELKDYFLEKEFPEKELNFIDEKKEQINLDNPSLRYYTKRTLKEYSDLLHKWFYFTDDEIIDIQLATLIGEKIGGDPLWLFLIAPPGALKTETLRSFSLSEEFYPLSDLTSKTFISGLMIGNGAKRRKIKDLLPQLDGKVLIFKDFTTILEKSRDERAEIFAQLREIYDGSFAKKVGTIDDAIRYDSRFGLIAGVTPVIDKYWKLMQQLGERFLKVRWEEDLDKTTKKARENEGKEKEMREEINEVAMGFITNLDFSKIPKVDDSKFGEELDKIAKFVAITRTPITIQDSRTNFYFDYIPIPERPTRLVKQLKKLCKALALIRSKDEIDIEEIETIRRVAKDTVPQDRLKILETIGELSKINPNGCSRSNLIHNIKIPESSIMRAIEQLKMLDLVKTKIVEKQNQYNSNTTLFYELSDFVKDILYPPIYTEQLSKKTPDNKKEQIDFTKTNIKEILREKKDG